MQKVSWLFIRFIAVMVPIVFLLNGLSKGNWVEALLFGLAVAVGLTPEMLPMIVTTNLAKGAVTMARRKTVVKRLNAIQNFGAMDVLCTDKTGTLTQDKVVLERHVNVVGEEDDLVLALAYLNSFYQTGLKNLLDVAVLEHAELEGRAGDRQGVREGRRDPVRLHAAADVGRRRSRAPRPSAHLQGRGRGDPADLQVRARRQRAPREAAHSRARGERRDDARALVAEMNEDGFRVVAVAYRAFPTTHGPYSVADESELILAGFIGFLDPPKESAAPALRGAGGAGNLRQDPHGRQRSRDAQDLPRRRARRRTHRARQRVRTLDDAALGAIASNNGSSPSSRPTTRRASCRALARGHTVGFLGDGINDAGALRQADVGVSVDSAVDIAKESADIILLEKSLLVLEEGVVEGRRTFGNTIKYNKMTASSNFGNVFSVLIASAFLPFLPMLPVQLFTVNLLYDFSQAAIPWDDMDPRVHRASGAPTTSADS